MAHLHRAAGKTPVFIAHGLHDLLASPAHAIDAYNALAATRDRISPAARDRIIEERVKEADCAPGFMLDGFPRTVPQADALEDVLARMGQKIDHVVSIEVPNEELVGRLMAPGVSSAERLKLAERSSKAIYLHSHMDEETFDTDRIRQCCVGIREPEGTNIPSCAYNVLYRNRDGRFQQRPAPSLTTLGPGRL